MIPLVPTFRMRLLLVSAMYRLPDASTPTPFGKLIWALVAGPLLFLLAWRPPRWQWAALGVLLSAYWLAWALYPAQPPGSFTGFLAHWNKGNNFGNAFDVWFLNLFPTVKPYVANGGGYLTLSFIPTLGTMILGLAAGQWLRASAPAIPMRRLLAAGAIGIAAGLLLHFTGICPVVKRIWTPAWTLFSGGLCFLFLAA